MELIRNVLYPVDSSIKCLKKEYNNGKCNVNEGNNSVYKENKKSEAVFVSN
jgi:hypothetical protein